MKETGRAKQAGKSAEPGPDGAPENTSPLDSSVADPDPDSRELIGDMPPEEFRRYGHQVVDWLADYFEHPEHYAVQPNVRPGALIDALPPSAPDKGEPMEHILDDFEKQILPHVTHWNHPGFMGYFATTGSAPGILAETLIAGLNNIGLLWNTSPALTELEQVTLRWLAEWLKLPASWFGMTLAGASVASLHAVIAAREAAREQDQAAGRQLDIDKLVLYTSEQAHSSIEKTMLVLGLRRDHCRKVPVDTEFRMCPEKLEQAIQAALAAGLRPFCIVGTVGTTSTTSVDPIPALADIAARYSLWLHVDAAYAGSAGILPEKRHFLHGCERADSFLFNPHKWLFTPMELTAFYCRRPEVLRRALSLVPDYLRSRQDPRAVNFMEYALPLGRRFRALKLWFVMRYFGRDGLSANLREHIRLAEEFAQRVDEHPEFERLAPVPFSVVCFRYRPPGLPEDSLNELNRRLVEAINAGGDFFLSSTVLDSRFSLRVAIGNIHTRGTHVDRLWELLTAKAAEIGSPAA
ncbi:MAG: pyridoxal-dependent decarboxylase [Acidobacteria bacterium]|nr:pyridoxal-dependent decarboxylase [Acidobacteriota bacterium]